MTSMRRGRRNEEIIWMLRLTRRLGGSLSSAYPEVVGFNQLLPQPLPVPAWSDSEVARLLAISSPPASPLSPWSSSPPQIPFPLSPPSPVLTAPPPSPIRSLGYRAATIRMRAKAAATSHSLPLPPPFILSPTRPDAPPPMPTSAPTSFPPLLLPSASHREDRPEGEEFVSPKMLYVMRYYANVKERVADSRMQPLNEYSPSRDDKKHGHLIGMWVWKLIQKLRQKGVYEESPFKTGQGLGGSVIQFMQTTMVPVQVMTIKIQAGRQVSIPRELTNNSALKALKPLFLLYLYLIDHWKITVVILVRDRCPRGK
ncbi:hypothetical protein Tco_0505580, partial [Tanacetum coccineum]